MKFVVGLFKSETISSSQINNDFQEINRPTFQGALT